MDRTETAAVLISGKHGDEPLVSVIRCRIS
jgi:hypothetical protein